jgi:hypothetical protein
MSLFWYPALQCQYDFDKPLSKGLVFDSYIKYYLARCQSMFIYTGLPESIPQKWLEHYLMSNGSCVFIKNGDDLVVTTGGMGGKPDIYYIPTEYIVANPYVEQSARKTYVIGQDCVLIRNDTYSQGLIPLLTRYCSQLTENDLTMQTADILSRAMLTITATDDQTKESVEKWLLDLRKGKLSAIGELPSMVGNQDRSVNITPFREVSNTITNLIEYHQYLKASLYNELGLNANYNMKRESINSNESQLNDDMLHPLIDNMLACRREALEEVNKMFGTNISVEFNSAWFINEVEEDLALEQKAAETETVEEIANGTQVDNVDKEESVAYSIPEVEESVEETDEQADAEQMPEEETTPEVETIVDAIETAAEVIADAIEGDTPEDDNEKDGDE